MRTRKRRPEWLRTARVLATHGFCDTSAGRTRYLEFLEESAGTEKEEEMVNAMGQGWIVGSSGFRD